MSRLRGAPRSLIVISVERAADVDLICGEAALLIPADIALVTGVRLDQLTLAGHRRSSRHESEDPNMRSSVRTTLVTGQLPLQLETHL
jgi:hypothetical protein